MAATQPPVSESPAGAGPTGRPFGDLGLPEVATDRVILRPMDIGDAARLVSFASDGEVAYRTSAIPHPYRVDDAYQWIREARAESAAGEAVNFAIARHVDRALIGVITLYIDSATAGTIGFWIGRPYWRLGYGTHALRAVARYAFETLGLEEITADALADNAASIGCQRKVGFELVDTIERPFRDGMALITRCRLRRPGLGPSSPGPRPPPPILLVVAVALIDADGRVLLARRPPGKPMAGLWEFPGGKVAPGETPEAALIRELKEELDIDVAASCLAPFTFASHRQETFHLLMPLYVCRVWRGVPTALEGQTLAWARPERLDDYPMPPADKPLVAMLRDLL